MKRLKKWFSSLPLADIRFAYSVSKMLEKLLSEIAKIVAKLSKGDVIADCGARMAMSHARSLLIDKLNLRFETGSLVKQNHLFNFTETIGYEKGNQYV